MTTPDAMLASNTSTLDIDEFAAASGRPAQVIGHHFFSPANVMKLLEIVRGRETSTEVIATSLKLAKQLNKVGVVVGNCFGFVANRMLAYYMREAYLLLEEGASVPQIDKALTDFGMPVGPFGMQDIAGIDVGARIRQHLKSIGKTRAEGRSPRFPIASTRWAATARRPAPGWYRYEAGSRTRIPDPLVDEIAAEGGREARHHAACASQTTRSSRASRRRSPTKARACSKTATPSAPATSTSSTATASASRATAAARCSTPTPSACRRCSARVNRYREQFGDYWQPAPLLEKLAIEGPWLLR